MKNKIKLTKSHIRNVVDSKLGSSYLNATSVNTMIDNEDYDTIVDAITDGVIALLKSHEETVEELFNIDSDKTINVVVVNKL